MTPMMKQYQQAKRECGDALLLFRMGDFYELFYQDAEIAAKALGLTLTSRDKATQMAGFPYHQLESYLAKLIKQGFRVAVCEQVEDPKSAKGLVRREINQLVSPGTVTDLSLLDPSESNYLAAVVSERGAPNSNVVGLSWIDLSTGRFQLCAMDRPKAQDLLIRLAVSEVLIDESRPDDAKVAPDGAMITTRPSWSMALKKATDALLGHFGVATLEGFGVNQEHAPAVQAAGAIVQFLRETQSGTLDHIDQISPLSLRDYVDIDQATWRSLEISRTCRSNSREGSLLATIDRCVTPMGSRLLGIWMTCPLTDVGSIERRQDAIEELGKQPTSRIEIRKQLKNVFDLQRLVSRVATGRAMPRDLIAIGRTLGALPALKAKLAGLLSHWLSELEAKLDLCAEVREEIEAALVEPAPAHLRDGGFIKAGYRQRLDELRELASGGKQWIANYQQAICAQTGISSLKVGYNKVFGYYLEVTNTHKDKVPASFIRKQTLKNAERYITPELKEYEEKVLAADEQARSMESDLFASLREVVRTHISRLKTNAELIATLDVIAALAELAVSQSYCRPQLTTDKRLLIVEGRHPVLDLIEPTGAFVPNDTAIDDEIGFLHLITGPNMAGKSTYIRQIALITLMAQIGSFVPAKQATIGVVDRIFARIGASDELTRGQSTFMVEMTETARILNTATERSLVILDEIGRGTSTYDGVSLAWSIVEFIHDQIGSRTLFATHYHELTELEAMFPGVKNYNIAVREWDEQIVFLHKIVPGAADKSYGIQVAKLAGVPGWVNRRAEQILKKLERDGEQDPNRLAVSDAAKSRGAIQLTLFETVEHPLIDKIRKLDANGVTPIQALQMISNWKSELAEAE
jgi:DNA mismatch repair protein MutS